MALRLNKISSILIQVLLGILFLFSLIRFINIVIEFGRDLLLQDFSAYYTAGQALNYGLSPYLNNLTNIPPLWDGIAHFRFSRFLYPPLVAAFFQPLALAPYPTAKYLWEIFTLLCLAASLFLTARIFPLKTVGQFFLVGSVICLSYPLQTHLDRGQIDLVTLLIVTLSVLMMIRNTPRGDVFGGILLAFSTLLKLQCIYVLPFLLVKRRWQALKGFVYGGVLIVMASVIVFGGPRSLYEYVRYELPRISGITTVNDAMGKANSRVLDSLRQNLPDGYSVKDGIIYQKAYFSAIPNASLVSPIFNSLVAHHIQISRTVISLTLLLLFFVMYWLWNRKFAGSIDSTPKEFMLWQIPLLIVLLTGPLTWVMNTVWLLPLVVVVVSFLATEKSVTEKIALLAICIGLLVVLVDNTILEFLNRLWIGKAMTGELIVLAGLAYYLSLPKKYPDSAGSKEVKSKQENPGFDTPI